MKLCSILAACFLIAFANSAVNSTSTSTTRLDSTTTNDAAGTTSDASVTTGTSTTTKDATTSTSNTGSTSTSISDSTSTTRIDASTTTKYNTTYYSSSSTSYSTSSTSYSTSYSTSSTSHSSSTTATSTTKYNTSTTKYSTTTTHGDPSTTSTSTKIVTTTTDDHGQYDCSYLDGRKCIEYARCAWIVMYQDYSDDTCDGECGYCVSTSYYGTCKDYREHLMYENYYASSYKSVACYGDETPENIDAVKCYDYRCYGKSFDDCMNNVNLDAAGGCIWVETGDQCRGDLCGSCTYANRDCLTYKQCNDYPYSYSTVEYYCDRDSVTTTDCNTYYYTTYLCDESCKDLTYDDCVSVSSCVWLSSPYYSDSNDYCNGGQCGYCSPACSYGTNNTCEHAKWYYECRDMYVTDSSTGSNGGSTYTATEAYCAGDEPPDNVHRCYVSDYYTDTNMKCSQLDYENCIAHVAVDDYGGCAWVVSESCGSSCGYCTAIPYECPEWKSCHDVVSTVDSSASYSNNYYSLTYYCGDETPETKDCIYTNNRCSGLSVDECLADGSNGHCAWYQYRSLDYRCGWCGFVCDSCAKEQKRIYNAYSTGDYFYGARYTVVCDLENTGEDDIQRDCRNCYGRKSDCANAFCADETKACNADEECSRIAYKEMCLDYKESDGSYFYAALVSADKDNQPLNDFAACMKGKCFDDTDSENNHEYDSQTTLEAGSRCEWGYAVFEGHFKVCLDTKDYAVLCSANYAVRFRNVVAVNKKVSITWIFEDETCALLGVEKDARRLATASSASTENPETTINLDENNPWDRLTKSTEPAATVPADNWCIDVLITVTYLDKETYAGDKDKYGSINADALFTGANIELTYDIECCKEDDVCQNVEGSVKGSVKITSLLAIFAAVVTILFV